MSKLDMSVIQQWSSLHNYHIPESADYTCPNCKESSHHHRATDANFSNLSNKLASIQMQCTRCKQFSYLWAVGVKTDRRFVEALYVWPDIKEDIPSTRDFTDFEGGVVPERVLKTYKDAVRAFEAEIWDGAGTLCGKTLEGAVKSRLPDDKQNVRGLGNQLDVLKDETDLATPFNQLTDAIRKGRNLSAHFDEQIDIDRETAKALIELVEYVLEFFFVFEKKSHDVKARIFELSSEKSTESSPANEAT